MIFAPVSQCDIATEAVGAYQRAKKLKHDKDNLYSSSFLHSHTASRGTLGNTFAQGIWRIVLHTAVRKAGQFIYTINGGTKTVLSRDSVRLQLQLHPALRRVYFNYTCFFCLLHVFLKFLFTQVRKV